MQLAAKLHEAVATVAPVVGISIGDETDRSTWFVQFDETATPEQRQAARNVIERYEPNAPTEADYARAIQAHIDATAQSRGYADGVALASYKLSTVEQWAAEAAAFIAWRDSVWLSAYVLMEAVKRGEIAQPTVEDIVAKLPPMAWPE